MADIDISDLPLAIALDGSEYAPIVQGGTTKRAQTSMIGNLAAGQLPTGGTTGQALVKASNANYNCTWETVPGTGTVTSVGLSLPAIFNVSGSPITITGTLTGTLATQVSNSVWAGPTSGAAAAPAFRALVGADLPNPSATTLGGIQSIAAVASNWVRSISTSGVPALSQPAFSDISGSITPSQFSNQSANTHLSGPTSGGAASPTFRALVGADLPNPGLSALGGIQAINAVSSNWIRSISTSGVPALSQPAFSDISGTIASSQITVLPAGVFANPSASIGLTANNGSATTAMRSDGTPALSQAIVPTWTGLHTWTNGGIALTGTPPLSGTFTGSGGAANFWLNQTGAAASATVPEIGAQFTLTSNVGTANKTTAYKIGLTGSVIGGANSADIYSINTITHGFAGAGGYLVVGNESDINNVGANANTLGSTTAAYSFVAVGAGSFESTAGYWATASGSGKLTYGFATSNTNASSIKTADFHSESSSVSVLDATGTHTNGADFSGATITGSPFKSTGFSVNSTGSIATIGLQFSGSTALAGPSIFQNTNVLIFGGGTSGFGWDNQAIGTSLMTLGNTGGLTLLAGAFSAPSANGYGLAGGGGMIGTATYTQFVDPSGNNDVSFGGVGDPTNYFSNTSHKFYNRASNVQYAQVDANGVSSLGYLGSAAPVTKTGTSSTVAASDSSIIYNASGTHTTTLPAAASFSGRWLYVKNIAAQTVNSASSNVVPLAGGAAGTALLVNTAGKFASLQSDGTNWILMSGN